MEYTIPKNIQKELYNLREKLKVVIEKGGKYNEEYFYIKNRLAGYEKYLKEQMEDYRSANGGKGKSHDRVSK